MTPSHLVIFLKGDLLQISSGLVVMLEYFCFTEFCVLELSRDDCLFHRVWCDWFLLGMSEFSFLVNWLSLNLPCLLFLILDLARSFRACLRFYSIFSFVFVSRGRRAVSFPVLFSRTPFRFFSCFVLSNPIRWHLKLPARALVSYVCFFFDLSHTYLCGPGWSHMDV